MTNEITQESRVESPFFSIIVPVYNVEKYLEHSVESVIKQTFFDYELILVDDGSTDNCGAMCDKYAEQYSRIRVIHKNNGGLSSARNAGISDAKGRYLIFLDSDDFWDEEAALFDIHKNLLETKADVLIFPAKRYYEENNSTTLILNCEVDRRTIVSTSKNESLRYMIENNIFRAAAWNKVISKKIISKNEMSFKEGYLSEDMDWCGDLLVYAEQFDYYDNPFYCYRQQRTGSITSGKEEKLVADKLFMCEKGYEQVSKIKDDKLAFILGSYYAYEYSVLIGVSAGVKDGNLIKRMKALRSILRYDACNKVKQVNKLMKLVGFSLTRKVLCAFVKIKR